MAPHRLFRRLLLPAFALTLLTAHYLLAVRPMILNWGATPWERAALLPGDEIVRDRGAQSTRAITIDAPIEKVWPWLAQIGQDRGGFYSFDELENMVGCQMPTADVLRPDKQTWNVGDKLWMYPSDGAGGIGYASLRTVIPGRALAFATRMVGTPLDKPEDGSWAFILEGVDEGRTRVIVRGRASRRQTILGAGFDAIVFDPLHFVMERRMMIGLKELAESGTRSRPANHVHVLLWVVTVVMMIAAAVLTVRRPGWNRPLLSFFAAAATFEFLTLFQPLPGLGAALVVLLASLLAERRKTQTA